MPSGTVTFLFTDMEGSTRRWEEDPDAMQLGAEFDARYPHGQALDETAMISLLFSQLDAIIESSGEQVGS